MLRAQTRRDGLEVYRDILMAVKNTDGKITRIMNWTGLGYASVRDTLDGMISRRLVQMVKDRSGEKRRRGDRRTEYHYEILEKGEHVGKFLMELLDYIEDGTEPDPRSQPPIVLLRLAMGLKGLTFEKPMKVEALPSAEGLKTEAGEVSEVIHVHRGWYDCPRCGHSVPSLKGLKMHVTVKHREERKKVLAEVESRFHLP